MPSASSATKLIRIDYEPYDAERHLALGTKASAEQLARLEYDWYSQPITFALRTKHFSSSHPVSAHLTNHSPYKRSAVKALIYACTLPSHSSTFSVCYFWPFKEGAPTCSSSLRSTMRHTSRRYARGTTPSHRLGRCISAFGYPGKGIPCSI